MKLILHLLLIVLLTGLFLYSKLLPYKDRLNPQYKGIFNFFSSIFTPLLQALRSVFKPVVVGLNLSVDLTQVILFVLLLLLLLI